MTACEKRLARAGVNAEGLALEEVGRSLCLNPSSLWDLFADEFDESLGTARKPSVSEEDKHRLVAFAERVAWEVSWHAFVSF